MVGLFGSYVNTDIGKFLGTPCTMFHSEFSSSMFSLTKIPPLTPPAKTFLLDVSLGSNIIPFVLPAILVGPLGTQAISGFSPGTPATLIFSKSSISSCILNKFSVLGLPRTGSIVNSHILSLYGLGGSFRSFLSDFESFFVCLNGLLFKLI